MTSFGLCKVFHYKYMYNTTGHNFIGHYYVLHKEHGMPLFIYKALNCVPTQVYKDEVCK